MVIAGIGLGMMMQIFVLSVQNSVSRSAMGSATALTQFSRSIGATLGVTLMGVIVNQRLPAGVRDGGHRDPPPSAGRPRGARERDHAGVPVRRGGLRLVFVISLLWVREVPLRHGFEDAAGRGRGLASARHGSALTGTSRSTGPVLPDPSTMSS